MWAVVTPFLMNTAGWLLTENGRQPWIVQGLMKTINANSPSVTSTDIWISLVAFVADLHRARRRRPDADAALLAQRTRRRRRRRAERRQRRTAIPALTY